MNFLTCCKVVLERHNFFKVLLCFVIMKIREFRFQNSSWKNDAVYYLISNGGDVDTYFSFVGKNGVDQLKRVPDDSLPTSYWNFGEGEKGRVVTRAVGGKEAKLIYLMSCGEVPASKDAPKEPLEKIPEKFDYSFYPMNIPRNIPLSSAREN